MKTRSKIYLIISGILMILTGIITLMNPSATLVSLAFVIGMNTLISGIMTLCFYFDEARGEIGAGSVLFDGIANIMLGLMFLGNNLFVASILPYVFAMWAIFIGIQMMIHCTDFRKIGVSEWWVELILGILVTLLGILTCMKPLVGAITISVFVGIGFIVHGAIDFYIVYEMKKVGNKLRKIAEAIESRLH